MHNISIPSPILPLILLPNHHLRTRTMHPHLRSPQHPIHIRSPDRRTNTLRRRNRVSTSPIPGTSHSAIPTIHTLERNRRLPVRPTPARALRPIPVARARSRAQIESRSTSLHDIHQLIQHHELEAQLQTVDGGLEDGLDGEEVCVFGGEEGHVEGDDGDVDPDEVVEDGAGFGFLEDFSRLEDLAGFPEVEARDDGFLDGEAGHLDFLVDFVDGEPVGGGGNGRVGL